MNSIQFIQEYLKTPRSVGAIWPSSSTLAKAMVAPVRFDQATCIVEFGPGTGVFTERLVEKLHPHNHLVLIENNELFYETLKKKYATSPNIHLIYGSAEDIVSHIQQKGFTQVDYIVSGLPFTSLPEEISTRILTESQRVLSPDGEFITFQYSKKKLSFISSYFRHYQTKRVLWNLPPAHVIRCSFQ